MGVNTAETLRQRFNRWHRDNPHVYTLFVQFAREARSSGLKKFSADAILHRIRWHVAVETKGDFKVNNNSSAFYARMLVESDPSFSGFFEMRRATADEVAAA